MKGVIFAELIRWVEEVYSPAIADRMIVESAVPGDGVYTAVGSYPHEQALAMVGALSGLTGEPVPQIADAYGYWLAKRFVELYPEMFVGYSDTISFLHDVDSKMHREARKLYPDARTPKVIAEVDGQDVVIFYSSHRPLADVAYGLVRGYIDFFDDGLDVLRDTSEPGPHAARFRVVQKNAATA